MEDDIHLAVPYDVYCIFVLMLYNWVNGSCGHAFAPKRSMGASIKRKSLFLPLKTRDIISLDELTVSARLRLFTWVASY